MLLRLGRLVRGEVAGEAAKAGFFGFEEDVDEIWLVEEVVLVEDIVLCVGEVGEGFGWRLLEYEFGGGDISEAKVLAVGRGSKMSLVEAVPPLLGFPISECRKGYMMSLSESESGCCCA